MAVSVMACGVTSAWGEKVIVVRGATETKINDAYSEARSDKSFVEFIDTDFITQQVEFSVKGEEYDIKYRPILSESRNVKIKNELIAIIRYRTRK